MVRSTLTPSRVILASSSPYRRGLLARLGTPFESISPEIDERPKPGESAQDTATRLALEKALAIQKKAPDATIIGSDQVAECEGHRLEKPGTYARAKAQLQILSGKCARFETALAVLTPAHPTWIDCVPTDVTYRKLDNDTIERYLRFEQPYDCAGSAKIEGAGILLIEKVLSSDPTALIGLPLIRLSQILILLRHPLLDRDPPT